LEPLIHLRLPRKRGQRVDGDFVFSNYMSEFLEMAGNKEFLNAMQGAYWADLDFSCGSPDVSWLI
jgi:hypothetical protein